MVKVKSILLYLSFVILTSAAIISCSDDDIINISTPVPVDSSQFRYPFTDGTSWNYKRSSFATDIRPDSIRHYFDNYPIIRTGKITILHDTVINFVTVKIFLEEYNIDNQTTIINRFYYINTDTALIYYSDKQSGNSSGFVPFRSVNGNSVFEKLDSLENALSQFSQMPADSVLTTLKYPLVTGKEWETFYPNSNSVIFKRYAGFENINTPAGIFSCMKLQNIIWDKITDYYFYSKFGLMKRFRLYDDFVVTTPENPDGIGTFDLTNDMVVTSYIIPSD